MFGLMMLQRVVSELLFPFGEHYAVDLRFGPRADQCYVLIHLGQPAAEAPIVHCKRPSRSTSAF